MNRKHNIKHMMVSKKSYKIIIDLLSSLIVVLELKSLLQEPFFRLNSKELSLGKDLSTLTANGQSA